MILKVFLIVLVLLLLAFAGMAITILLKKGGKFPSIHIGGNKEMRKKGIKCVQAMDHDEQKEYKPIEIEKNKKIE